MAVTVAWVVILAGALAWELLSRVIPGRWTTATDICAHLWRRGWGRVVLVAVWGWVGVHLFVRGS